MILDIANQLCLQQAFTGALTVSTNSYAKQSAAQDLSIGRRMSLAIFPKVAAGAGSTHTMNAIQADDAALTVNVTVLATLTLLAAQLVPGTVFELQFPQKSMTQSYLGFSNSSSGGTTTVTLDVHLVPSDEMPGYRSFPKVVDALV